MSLLKRLSATVYARVGESVRQIENHDAIIEASLRETRHLAAQAKVRLNRVQADGEKQQKRLKEAQDTYAKWTQRAGEQAEQDEAVALDCLSRRRESRERISELENAVVEQQAVKKRLQTDLKKLEQRLTHITEQRNLMRSRQSAAEVNRCLQEIQGLGCIDINDTFERWEMRITEAEMAACTEESSDEFEQRFLDEEMKAELRAELDAIRNAKEV